MAMVTTGTAQIAPAQDHEESDKVESKRAGRKKAGSSREDLELSKLIAERDKIAIEAVQAQGTALNEAELEAKKTRVLCRDEAELEKVRSERDKIGLEVTQLRGSALDAAELQARKQRLTAREQVEFDKLSDERNKLSLELTQLKGKELQAHELQSQKSDEIQKRTLELAKLKSEARNARLSQRFETARVAVSTLTIAGSIIIAGMNIAAQQNKDRASDISKQLVEFNEKITDTNVNKQINAISAVRSLREHAIPSLVTNLDLNHGQIVFGALKTAVLRLNENPDLRRSISNELLVSIKYITLRQLGNEDVNAPSVKRNVDLWSDCMRQASASAERSAMIAEGKKLGEELTQEMKAKVKDKTKLDGYLNAVQGLLVITGS
jgi:hypothetical protein